MNVITYKRKPNYGFSIFLLFIAIYIGYAIGTLGNEQISLEYLDIELTYALTNPLPFRITEWTGPAIAICALIWLIGFLYYIVSVRNYMPGQEYGTARFANPKEANRRFRDKDRGRNKILSEHVRISCDWRRTELNNNAIFIGGSGAGKTFYAVKPNGYNCTSNYVFTDPKGELLRDVGAYLESHGYRIIVLNLVDMINSDRYNPFRYLRKDEDVIKLITNLIANTTPKMSTPTDPFWEKAETMFLQALMYYVWYEFPKQGKTPNFRGLMELLNKAKVPEDETELTELDELMYALDPKHPALVAYNSVRSGAADTVRSIIISAKARLAYLQNESILRILDEDDINIPFLGEGWYENPERKVALFCVIPDYDKSYNFVVGMLYTQIFQELYYVADHKYKGPLPVGVAFWMDEFANVALPNSFCELLSTMRSRNISCNIIIQNMAQIKALFEKTWETITGNCDVWVYLGGNELSTHEYINKTLGKWTIDKRTTGQTLGMHGSSNRNDDVLGRELLTPDEIRKLDNKKCIIFIRGMDPILDDKYKTYQKPEFKEAVSMGAYIHNKDRVQKEHRLSFYMDFDPENQDVMNKWLYVQVEDYRGVFEEHKECYGMLEDTETAEGVFKRFHGSKPQYYYDGSLITPAFETVCSEVILSGGNKMHKHNCVGYFNEFGDIHLCEEDIMKYIFVESNRMDAAA